MVLSVAAASSLSSLARSRLGADASRAAFRPRFHALDGLFLPRLDECARAVGDARGGGGDVGHVERTFLDELLDELDVQIEIAFRRCSLRIVSLKTPMRRAATSARVGIFIGLICVPVKRSISRIICRSRGVMNSVATPLRPARPVRPMRWTYASTSYGMS